MSSSTKEEESGRGGVRKTRKAATRKKLVEAARHCFAERGYAGTNIADIAGRAGVAHGTFYVHFPGKEMIVEQLLEEFNGELAGRLGALWEHRGEREFEALVPAMAELFLDYWEERRDFVELAAERVASHLTVRSFTEGVNPPVADLVGTHLRAFAAERGARPGVADLVATGLMALWFRVGMQYVFGDRVDRGEAVQALTAATVGTFERAFAPQPT